MTKQETEKAIAEFVAKYTPAIAKLMTAARSKMRKRIPRGYEMVYDNYNALAIGYGATDKASSAVVSIAAYPKWVTLFFLKGAALDDPHGLLEGTGSTVRGVRLAGPETLGDPRVVDLLNAALDPYAAEFAAAPKLTTVVKSVSAKQRPRRPK